MVINKNKAYVLGALRDGSFIHNKKYGISRIKIYQKNHEWIQTLSEMFSETYDVKSKILKDERDNVWSLMINSVKVYNDLLKISDYPGNQHEWNTPSIILQSSKELKSEYIKGFFDAEGGLPHIEKGFIEPKNIRIHFTQSNKICLEEIKEMLSELGFHTGKVCGPYFKKGYKKPIFRLKIHGKKEVSKFAKKIGSNHPEKMIRLSIINDMAQDLCEA